MFHLDCENTYPLKINSNATGRRSTITVNYTNLNGTFAGMYYFCHFSIGKCRKGLYRLASSNPWFSCVLCHLTPSLIKLPWIHWIFFSFYFMLIHYWTLPQQECPDLRLWFLGTIWNIQNNTVYFSCKENTFPYKIWKCRHVCTCTHSLTCVHTHKQMHLQLYSLWFISAYALKPIPT